MKSLAVVSSGFLRNYRRFLRSDLHRRMTEEFACDFYVSTWEEDGYGSSWTPDYTSRVIPEERIRSDFGGRLRFLRRESFAEAKERFRYSPVRALLRDEPQVLEKYRAKFHSLSKAEVPDGYDIYFHVRFDIETNADISEAILGCLRGFDRSDGVVYTNKDVFDRRGCFGDIFQVVDHASLLFLQMFNERLYDDKYLDMDIPRVPEAILYRYFSYGAPCKEVRQIPVPVDLNRIEFE